jgi:hypothetical protein
MHCNGHIGSSLDLPVKVTGLALGMGADADTGRMNPVTADAASTATKRELKKRGLV